MAKRKRRIDLKKVFRGLQAQMEAKLTFSRQSIQHPGAKGTAAELEWNEMLSTYLPRRYAASKAFVIDSRGRISDEIDIVVFDRQYSPLMVQQNGLTLVPAECVYAVIEVKQTLTASNLKYAQAKAASVRRLHRTSVPIPYADGVYPRKKPPTILAGIVALDGTLSDADKIRLSKAAPSRILHVGCSLLGRTSFRLPDLHPWKPQRGPYRVEVSKSPTSLVAFFLALTSELQRLGTVAAMDLSAYSAS